MLILDCISDTHTKHSYIEFPKPILNQEDTWILVHAGDFTYEGLPHELDAFKKWLMHQDHHYKVVIAGNHELTLDGKLDGFYEFSKCPFVHYLQETGVTLGGYNFWGTPYTPRFYDWAFQTDHGEDDINRFAKIPLNTDVVLTHGPALGVADLCPDIDDRDSLVSVGSYGLRKRLREVKPVLAVSGHLHTHAGWCELNECTYVNAAVLNEKYQPTGRFYRVYIEGKTVIKVESIIYE